MYTNTPLHIIPLISSSVQALNFLPIVFHSPRYAAHIPKVLLLSSGPYEKGVRRGSTEPYFCSLKLILSLNAKININLIHCASRYSYMTTMNKFNMIEFHDIQLNILIINIFFECLFYYGI